MTLGCESFRVPDLDYLRILTQSFVTHSDRQLAQTKAALAKAETESKQLQAEEARHLDHISRLSEANDILSQRALTLADEMEREKKLAHGRLEREIESLKKQLKSSDDRIDEERAR